REDFMEDITYSAASAADLPALRSLLEACDLPSEDLTAEHLEHFILCRAGATGARIVGSVGLELFGDVGLLRSLAVATELRGRRLGHELWARSRERARASGIERLYLLTTTAERLFARWGFQRIPRDQAAPAVRSTTEFTTMCPSTAAVMVLELAAGAA